MFLRFVALAALVAAPLYAQAPATAPPAVEKLPDGRVLIDAHVKATGGRQALMSYTSMHSKATLSMPANGISGPVEIWATAEPQRTLVKMTIPGVGEIMEGFDGTNAWSVNPMTGPMLKTGAELAEAKFDGDFRDDIRDPKKYPTVKTLEKTTFEGRPCYKVLLTRSDGGQDTEFYDVATGLRAGTQKLRTTPMGPMTTVSVESDYKKFGKVMVATKVSQKVMGIEQVITLTSIDYEKVDPAVFELPAAIKALIK
jgi:hypothetical protein